MRKRIVTAALVALTLPAFSQQPAPATESKPAQPATTTPAAPNPFFEEWTGPFGVPPFDRIKAEHFLPAFEKAIEQRKSEVAAITKSAEPATFANTIEALENGGLLLAKVSDVFFALSGADTNDTLQGIAKQVSPKLSALRDDILLDEALFRRVKSVYEQREKLTLSVEQKKLLDETWKDFVRGGANLSPEQKKRFREINQELAALGLKFGDNLLKETNSYRLVIEKKEDLAGLPPALVAQAADAAKAAKLEGKWVFTLQAPSIFPFLTFSENRELRRQILTAYATRGDHDNEFDNKKGLARVAALRVERANLLGYKTHADFVLAENMAKTPARVYELIDKMWKPALGVAKKEAADLQASIKANAGTFKLEPWDWRFYAEKVRKQRYDLADDELRPYFAIDRVREGAFHTANKLYGLTFTERPDLPKYHSEVRTFEVKDADGTFLALLTMDFHPRPGKRGGAWCGRLRSGWARDGKSIRPIVTNVSNFSRSAGDAPALLSLEEVRTLFHEFGHALHGIVSKVQYRSMGRTPRDFVELPSQIMENWALEPEVLKVYAKHWKTGEPIPAELVAKINKAATFNQGFQTVEYLSASLLDMDWHTLTEPKELDATAFEKASLEKIGMMPEIIVRYRSPYFNHIFGPGGSYSAGYYSYVWAEVLDADAFDAFKEKGVFDPATAKSFRTNILEKGGTEDAMVLFKRFRGREPVVEPLLLKRGLAQPKQASRN
jgi:peptidyl-dipeptidase Dcp